MRMLCSGEAWISNLDDYLAKNLEICFGARRSKITKPFVDVSVLSVVLYTQEYFPFSRAPSSPMPQGMQPAVRTPTPVWALVRSSQTERRCSRSSDTLQVGTGILPCFLLLHSPCSQKTRHPGRLLGACRWPWYRICLARSRGEILHASL